MTIPAIPAIGRASPELERIAEELRDLRPVIDPVLEIVLVDCPSCRAGDADPLGLYRPLQIVPRGKRTIHHCTACGRHDER